MNPKYSVVIPVYNRPDEVDELLQSLTGQTYKDFEVVVVEDGSSIPCKQVVEKYEGKLDVHYFEKPNSGPGQTRNYAAERSRGEYLLILDSDCILPATYLAAVEAELQREPADAFGGPDRAHDSFTDVQKAINYAMTSFSLREESGEERRKWTSSTPAVSTWESGPMCIRHWADSPGCVSARTSTSVSVSSREDIAAGCFRKHGCGISAVRI